MDRCHRVSFIGRIVPIAFATAWLAALVSSAPLHAEPVHVRAPGPNAEKNVALDAPTDLSVARFKPDVVLRWAYAGRGITGFQIERATGPGDFVRVGSAGRDARTFRDREARAGVAYTYRVRAVAVGAASAYSKEVIVTVNASARR